MARRAYTRLVWNQPYLETCCRAALHRLVLAADAGRPGRLKDGPCLDRLVGMGLAAEMPGEDGELRYGLTDAGLARHTSEILGRSGGGQGSILGNVSKGPSS